MRVAWQNQNLRRMGKYEPPPLKMLIRAFLRGNDLKAFLFPQSAFFAFPRLCHLKPTTATTTWNSKQMLYFAIFCLFRRSFLIKFIISLFLDNVKFIAKNRTLGYDIAFSFVNIVSLFYFVAVIIKSKREKHQSFSLFDLMILCLITHTLPTFLKIIQRKISVVQVEVLFYFYSKQKYYVWE